MKQNIGTTVIYTICSNCKLHHYVKAIFIDNISQMQQNVYQPAFCAIATNLPIFFCCLRHNPVILRGNIQPSDLTNWLTINTSVCLTSSPSAHI